MQTVLFLQISVAFMALVECCGVAVGNTQTSVGERHPPVGNDKHDFKIGAKGAMGCCCFRNSLVNRCPAAYQKHAKSIFMNLMKYQ